MKVIAAGNDFYGDDGVGAVVLDEIRKNDILPGVDLIDIQTDALALLDHLEPGVKTVIVDAARMGLEPGAVAVFRPEEAALRIRGDHLSVHGFGLAEAFAMARGLGVMPADVLIVGVEPARIEINRGLSDEARAAVPRVLSIIAAEVRSDG
ncbi:MAG: hydrogenase maturation protease [Krumholzibacteria bacterium]|nr:hydrogenase maturation protease [Candidatus Krumholzibacteria bacterium]